jgi:hypothetical protein
MSAVAGWYHCSVKPVSRSAGRSAVAAAAYRLGESLHDRQLGETYDYTRRSGVMTAFTVAPLNAPDWVHDPEALWNAAEAAETRINSQVAREYELALPSSVGADAREGIVRAFAQKLVDRYGVAVTAAIHEPSRYGDERNFHAHILSTTRTMGADGLGKKTRVLDDRKTGPQEVLYLRQYACDLINGALERAGVDERVDARSFEARGIDREATEHLGPTASEMERNGEHSERGDRNREIGEDNQRMDELVQDLAALDAEIAAEEERLLDDRYGGPEPETLTEAADAAKTEQPLSDADKRRAGDAVVEAEPSSRQSEDGAIRQPGLITTWWERAVSFARRLSGITAAEDDALTSDADRDKPPTVAEARTDALERTGAREPDANTAFDLAADDYTVRMAEALRQQESAPPWTTHEVDVSPGAEAQEARDGRTWWQRAEEYAAGHASEIHKSGEIGWRDGFTWWERTAQVFGTVREQAADWVSGRWKSFVDLVKNERDNPRNGPDMDR